MEAGGREEYYSQSLSRSWRHLSLFGGYSYPEDLLESPDNYSIGSIKTDWRLGTTPFLVHFAVWALLAWQEADSIL